MWRKKCGFYLGTMKSCKLLETFLSPKNLTYCFAVETCLGEWWVTHWDKFLSWVNTFYQVWSWNRFDGLEKARWCDKTKREDLPDRRAHPNLRTPDLSMAFSTVNSDKQYLTVGGRLELGSRSTSAGGELWESGLSFTMLLSLSTIKWKCTFLWM